ncbi:hypothetical protein ACHQM5_016726 [Ranunculus cassubicifolius]
MLEKGLQDHENRFNLLQAANKEITLEVKTLTAVVNSLKEQMEKFFSPQHTVPPDITDLGSSPPPILTTPISLLGSLPQTELTGKTSTQITTVNATNGGSGSLQNTGYFKVPKIDFHVFEGEKVRVWEQKANRYFLFNPIEPAQKVLFASLFFKGRAELWYQSRAKQLKTLCWEDFLTILCHRFSSEAHENIIGEFNKLIQLGSLQEYHNKFEELQPMVLQRNPGLTESYFVDSYISGLRDATRHTVFMFHPKTLAEAMSLARLQEATLSATVQPSSTSFRQNTQSTPFQTYYTPSKPSNNNFHNTSPTTFHTPTQPVASHHTPITPQAPIKRVSHISQQEMANRREKGLCYFCEELYSSTHKCKQKQVFMIWPTEEDMTGIKERMGETSAEITTQHTNEQEDSNQNSEVSISLNALSGLSDYHTLVFEVTVGKNTITMLLDSGSTHNFLDASTEKKLGCKFVAIPEHAVSVAGGGQLKCKAYCPSFQWSMQGNQFSTDVRILDLGCCDLVLGVQWLRGIGPVTLDFTRLIMLFQHQGQTVIVQGCTSPKPCKLNFMSANALSKYTKANPNCIMGLLFAIQEEPLNTTGSEELPTAVQELLLEYADLFQEPNSLPPSRAYDHAIRLKEGTTPVTIRPYRYPQVQKNELERQVKEMLTTGIIQRSVSPFASPAILVRKNDRS